MRDASPAATYVGLRALRASALRAEDLVAHKTSAISPDAAERRTSRHYAVVREQAAERCSAEICLETSVELIGIEPTTSGLQSQRSPN